MLKPLSVEGDVVTIDAMGTQTKIAEQIVNGNKADYTLHLKSNQPTMYNDVALFFTGVDNECKKEADGRPDNAILVTDVANAPVDVSADVKLSAEIIIKCFSGKDADINMARHFKDFKSPPRFFRVRLSV